MRLGTRTEHAPARSGLQVSYRKAVMVLAESLHRFITASEDHPNGTDDPWDGWIATAEYRMRQALSPAQRAKLEARAK